jgi:hypothetical protein
MPKIFGKEIDLGPSRFPIRSAACHFCFAGHGAVIIRWRHCLQHRAIKIIGKNAIKLHVMKRLGVGATTPGRVHDELNQIFD